MTLATSGSISLYCGACASRSVLTELRIANPGRNLPISMSDADVKSLARVGSNAYSMSAFYGKSSFTSALHVYTSGSNVTETFPNGARNLVVEAWGHGGGGGTANNILGGGGGGGGGFSRSSFSIVGGQTLQYTIGPYGSSSTVSSGSFVLVSTMVANSGVNGGRPAGGASGAASGGNQANQTGFSSSPACCNAGGGGAIGITGVVAGDGSPYGAGGNGGNAPLNAGFPGQNGAVVFYYT